MKQAKIKIRVLLADDHAVVRGGIRDLLRNSGDILVVAEASDGGTARPLIEELEPDVVVLDIRLPGESGIGKSELALGLVSRGQHLVADDSVMVRRTAPDVLEGYCHSRFRNFLEVRGLGIVNITNAIPA